MADLALRITVQPLSREQRREIDRAAKVAGLRPGPWCLSVALAAARVAGKPQPLSVAPKPALAPKSPTGPYADPAYSGRHPGVALLVKSFDPDA